MANMMATAITKEVRHDCYNSRIRFMAFGYHEFGKAYDSYARTVPAFLPILKR